MCVMLGVLKICTTGWEVNVVLKMKMRAIKIKSLHITMLMCVRSWRRLHINIQQPRVLYENHIF